MPEGREATTLLVSPCSQITQDTLVRGRSGREWGGFEVGLTRQRPQAPNAEPSEVTCGPPPKVDCPVGFSWHRTHYTKRPWASISVTIKHYHEARPTAELTLSERHYAIKEDLASFTRSAPQKGLKCWFALLQLISTQLNEGTANTASVRWLEGHEPDTGLLS